MFQFSLLRGVNDGKSPAKFADFLDYVAHEGPRLHNQFNIHWVPMYGMCDPCNIQYDFIIKTESLAAESQLMMEELGFESDIKLPHIFSFSSNSTWAKSKAYYEDLLKDVSVKTLERILAIYQLDFVLFDYDLTPFQEILKEKQTRKESLSRPQR